jgi:hypothetical protein
MTDKTDIIPRIAYGVPEIARVTGIPKGKLHYMLTAANGDVPGVTKIAGRWAMDTTVFFAAFPRAAA